MPDLTYTAPQESAVLLCYTREATGREYANNEDIAYSMHLAVRLRGDHTFTPLNENYGIFFAAAVPGDNVSHEARLACVAARRLSGEPLPQGRKTTDAVRYEAVMPGEDIELKNLRDPYLFRLSNHQFGIAATRTERGGRPDGSERSAFLLAVSKNLTSFDQLGLVKLDTDNGVHHPHVEYDPSVDAYRISWSDDDGDVMTAIVSDIEAAVSEVLEAHKESADASFAENANVSNTNPSIATEREHIADYDIDDIVPGNSISITDDEAEALFERFGRLHNTGVSIEPTAVISSRIQSTEAAYEEIRNLAHKKATLSYSDGSTAARAVEWNENELQELAKDLAAGHLRSGQRRFISGRVRTPRYPVPFAVERADPSVFSYDWNGEPLFLFIATDDTDGNCIDPRDGKTHMPLRVGKSIEELSDAAGGREREIDLLVRGDKNSEGRIMTGCFWAPELHIIGGRLSILFMPCFDGEELSPDGTANDRFGKPDMWTGSCHIMQLKQDDAGEDLDPRNPLNWSVPEPILGTKGQTLDPVQRISLDMTVFEDSGTCYYAWQQVGSVWIASVDPLHPTRLTSEPRQIIVPEFAWDNMIAEGPNAFVHDGRIFLIYSGSLVGIDYTTGLVTAPADKHANLLDPHAWTKLDYPLQKSGIYNGEWQLGTGHGMWSHDEDGNLIYVFHNAQYDNGQYGGRDAQVRRVHWSAEGMPILDMQAEEELDPAYAEPTMEVAIA